MKKIVKILSFLSIISYLSIGFNISLFAQILKPISWKSSTSKTEVKIGEEIDFIFEARIDKDWYLYSSDFDPNLGPQVTTFEFEPNSNYSLVGTIKPIKPKKKFDDLWGGEYTYFIGTGKFVQTVKVLGKDFKIKAKATYQVCTDISGRCIPLEEEFSFTQVKVIASAESNSKPQKEVKVEEVVPSQTTEIAQNNTQIDSNKKVIEKSENQELTQKTNPQILQEEATTIPQKSSSEFSLWMFMLETFFLGLLAIFTPCVFPMIPLTVSFFTKKGKAQALFYGFSIIFIYTAIGAIAAPLLGSGFANELSTHWFPNLLFFLIFIAFALSFFGMFEIVLPNKWVNQADAQADKGGFVGVFFMAFTLVLVSFSCTGPIVGSLLVASAGGEMLKPIAGMFAFSLAFALPFTVFAFFPSLLQKLPKSGGWLQSVKVTLGFIELALAFKFLSMIDLVYHLGILDREINIAIWIAIVSFMGLYYLGKIRLPHDDEVAYVSVPRMLLALVCFSFVVYLVPGMFGAPLKALSGVLPPQTTHDFDLTQIVRNQNNTIAQTQKPIMQEVRYSDKFKLPHGLQGYFVYQEGLEAAKKAQKPVFLDFTGHGCANCRKMEDKVWAESSVLQKLQEDFIIISLYVDDRTLLPENEWVTSSDGKLRKTIGAVNMWLQESRFQNNAQPFYVILDENGEMLLPNTIGYEPDVEKFNAFLQEGIKKHKDKRQALAKK
jgi:thiol:disulfide interchange protein DsbD